MNIYYKKTILDKSLSFYYASHCIEICLKDIIKAFSGKLIFEFESYEACHFLINDGKIKDHYYFEKQWNRKPQHIWQKNFYIIDNVSFIDRKISEIKDRFESIRLLNTNFFEFEVVAKFRNFTNFLEEPRRTCYDAMTLDTCYNIPFNPNKILKLEFVIEKWEKHIDYKDVFNLVAHCAFYTENLKITFRINIYSFKKLIFLSQNNIHPNVYIYSNHHDTNLLSDYINFVFAYFSASTIDELKLKISTFSEDVTDELLSTPLIESGEKEIYFKFLELKL